MRVIACLHLVRHRSSLKQRVHAVLLTHGKPCPVSDLFGVYGRQLLARLGLPEPWQGTLEASLRLIDELDREISDCERELRRLGADHRYVPLLCTVPGTSWVLAYTIAVELGAASPHRRNSAATAASARASTNPASATCAARSPSKAPATCAARSSRPPPTPAPTPALARDDLRVRHPHPAILALMVGQPGA